MCLAPGSGGSRAGRAGCPHRRAPGSPRLAHPGCPRPALTVPHLGNVCPRTPSRSEGPSSPSPTGPAASPARAGTQSPFQGSRSTCQYPGAFWAGPGGGVARDWRPRGAGPDAEAAAAVGYLPSRHLQLQPPPPLPFSCGLLRTYCVPGRRCRRGSLHTRAVGLT